MVFGKLSSACKRVTKVEFEERRLFFGRGNALGAVDPLVNGMRLDEVASGREERGTSSGVGGKAGLSDEGGESESEETLGSYPGI